MAMIFVKHASSKDEWKSPKDGSSSWIEYWKKHSGLALKDFCRDCGKAASPDDPLVGAHVQKVASIDQDYYIVPTHKSCNTQGASDNHSFSCDERALVPANHLKLPK